MKTLIFAFTAFAFYTSCLSENEPNIKPQTSLTTLARLEFTFRDSGLVTFSDNLLLEFDTIVYQNFTYEWDATFGCNLVVWGDNMDGYGDSVAIIKLFTNNEFDTLVINNPFSNGVELYKTI